MKRFFRKILVLILLVYFPVIIILLTVCPQYTHAYNAVFVDKMNRLESIREPKIVLVGDSNLAFGIQSELIESALGMPVVNLGLNGDLGNAFHERMPLFNLTAGDIIVIAHLDYQDDGMISIPEIALATVENYFHYWKIFRITDIPELIWHLPRYAYRCLFRFMLKADREPEPPTCYARSAFNVYGDDVFPRTEPGGEAAPYLISRHVNRACINRLNKLSRRCRAKGVSVVISSPPVLSGLPGFDIQEYIDFQNDIEKYSECPVISNCTDYIFDKSFFYAGAVHMTNDGARLRTEQLIKDLQKYMQ